MTKTVLDELFGADGAAAFRAAYPDRWLHTTGTAPASLFGWTDLNQVLTAATLPCQWVNIVVDGQRTTPGDLTELAAHVRAGHTLVVRHLERLHPQIARIAAELTTHLGEPVAVNLYVSQPRRQGFALHYDSHDVIAVHLTGQKTWRIYPRTVPYLISGTPENDRAEPEETDLLARPTLHPGDVLYLPRGQWHDAVADTECMHLAVGVHARTGIDLLTFLTHHLRAHADLRRPAPLEPIGATQVMGPRKRAHAADTLALIRAALDDPNLVDAYTRHLADHTQPRPRTVFPTTAPATVAAQATTTTTTTTAAATGTAASTTTAPTARFGATTGLRVHITAAGGGIEVTGHQARVTLPARLHPLVDALTSGEPFTVTDLADGLDEHGRAELRGAIRTFGRLGWVEPAPAG